MIVNGNSLCRISFIHCNDIDILTDEYGTAAAFFKKGFVIHCFNMVLKDIEYFGDEAVP